MLRQIFFTELNRRCFTFDDFALLFLQLHFHRYLSILVWESERSRNMVKMFSVTCLSNSWKNFREELVTLGVCVAPGMSIAILGLDDQEGCTWRVLLKHTLHPYNDLGYCGNYENVTSPNAESTGSESNWLVYLSFVTLSSMRCPFSS